MRKGHVQCEQILKTCCGSIVNRKQGKSHLCLISVPLQTRNRILGLINLVTSRDNLERDEDWVVVLTSIGQNLGLVIERAELETGSERLSRMEERTNLAHELHDSLAQTLAGIRYNVRVLENAIQAGESGESERLLDVVENSVEEANLELRELISRFRTPEDSPKLIPSIEEVIEKFKYDTGIKTVFQNNVEDIELPQEFESQIVRIVQEALANIKKHARSRTVRVMMRNDGENYHVLIEDDGVGFDDSKQSINPRDHIGLQVMRERAATIGGELNVESVPAEGTRVHLVFCH
jgi:two-component system nitrate/nitrite sensor histidine kinase NarX